MGQLLTSPFARKRTRLAETDSPPPKFETSIYYLQNLQPSRRFHDSFGCAIQTAYLNADLNDAGTPRDIHPLSSNPPQALGFEEDRTKQIQDNRDISNDETQDTIGKIEDLEVSTGSPRPRTRDLDRPSLLKQAHELLLTASVGDLSITVECLKDPRRRSSLQLSEESKSDKHNPQSRSLLRARDSIARFKSEENLPLLRRRASSTRSNSLSTQKSDNSLSLSRQTSSSTTIQPSIFSSNASTSTFSTLWSPIREETDTYRLTLLANPHYCTYGCANLSFRRKSDWINHEEQSHEPQITFTCLLHASDVLATDPCPGKLCVSVMDAEHLAHYHDSLWCFDNMTKSIDRYRTSSRERLFSHLLERHGLVFEDFPDSWGVKSEVKMCWKCGFCGGWMRSWKERADHVSLHFTREGRVTNEWQYVVNVPKVVEDLTMKPVVEIGANSIKRLSVVKEVDGSNCRSCSGALGLDPKHESQ